MRIEIPAHINASGLIPFIVRLSKGTSASEITLDFANLRRVTPAGLAVLTSTVVRWHTEHRSVVFTGLEECAITGYLQRMDLFQSCGMDLAESFRRHNAVGRFVPVRLIDHHVDEMGRQIAACLAPGGEDYETPMSAVYDLTWYVMTEVANNVRQHSGGLGYAAAQVTHREGLVRLAIADNGRGILASFREAGFGWAAEIDEVRAIQKALDPKISSKGSPTNEGVGLTLISGLARLTGAWLLIVSGSGMLRILPRQPPAVMHLPDGARLTGTLVALTLRRDRIADFAQVLHDAKVQAGLLPPMGGRATFAP